MKGLGQILQGNGLEQGAWRVKKRLEKGGKKTDYVLEYLGQKKEHGEQMEQSLLRSKQICLAEGLQ